MIGKLIKITLAALVLFFASDTLAGNNMDPAPADWPSFDYKREPAQFKRRQNGMIDPTPDVVSLKFLPKDNYGFVDWTKSIRDGLIKPRDSILDSQGPPPETSEPAPDVVIKSKLDFMPDVLFPHSAHTVWLKCSVCHPKIFKKKAGATPITMTGIWKGQFCGRCHDRVAFPTRNCFKCHSVPRQTTEKSTAP